MMRLLALLLTLLIPCAGMAETLSAAVDEAVNGLDLSALEGAALFASTGGVKETLRAIARGEMTLGMEQLWELLISRFHGHCGYGNGRFHIFRDPLIELATQPGLFLRHKAFLGPADQ